jgi:hypothetical protein
VSTHHGSASGVGVADEKKMSTHDSPASGVWVSGVNWDEDETQSSGAGAVAWVALAGAGV